MLNHNSHHDFDFNLLPFNFIILNLFHLSQSTFELFYNTQDYQVDIVPWCKATNFLKLSGILKKCPEQGTRGIRIKNLFHISVCLSIMMYMIFKCQYSILPSIYQAFPGHPLLVRLYKLKLNCKC